MLSYFDTTEEGVALMREYLQTKAKISELNERLDELKDVLSAALMEEPESKAQFAGYEWKVQSRKTWKYSDNVKNATKEVSALKKLEQAQGVAVVTKISSFPVVKAIPSSL